MWCSVLVSTFLAREDSEALAAAVCICYAHSCFFVFWLHSIFIDIVRSVCCCSLSLFISFQSQQQKFHVEKTLFMQNNIPFSRIVLSGSSSRSYGYQKRLSNIDDNEYFTFAYRTYFTTYMISVRKLQLLDVTRCNSNSKILCNEISANYKCIEQYVRNN